MRVFALTSLLLLLANNRDFFVQADSGLYPPGLLPLINKANILLSSGQFNEAARIYSEAIEQSPTDYLLYYKRATAYLSMQRHTSALEDFDKVLSLTSNTFDNAHLMKARIHTRDGHFGLAKKSLVLYVKAKGKDKDAEELEADINEGEQLREKAEKERSAELWNACVESASQALRFASHSLEIRTWRAECSIGAGDVESTVGDMTRLSHLLPPSTQLLTRTFKLSYYLLPPSPAPMNLLKQCLHYDPDSKPCLALRRTVKNFDKAFAQLDDLLAKEDWKGIIKLLMGPGGGKTGELWRRWEEALMEHVGQDTEVLPLVPTALLHAASPSESSTSTKKRKEPKIHLPLATKVSPQRQKLVRALCKSYIHLADVAKSSQEYKTQRERWCDELLTLDGLSDDWDGLVGRGETMLVKEDFEEAVRTFERAFEASGRSDRDIHQRLQKAQKLLKQSKQKDYYKIVGVSRDADARTIKKAFRKAAKTAHPDKGGSEAKMALLNEAYEVLSNPELRQRFDNGEDPMDPMAQQGGHPFANGQHPFAQFFQQQGGRGGFPGGGFPGGQGGFQFHFNSHH
ncbi:hypothetical protein D9619_012758 [Psilocybe cf. subviscida]|uniref:J domain-containing protein n=1 Tax=Psilocybe cf. subviscida TaxID=2480587 RepID=A0A8H5ERB5_9AGAR|nr:hypothetical protein D9619_012758 [Psilocybe cf. subviscida]